jgi:putative transposase
MKAWISRAIPSSTTPRISGRNSEGAPAGYRNGYRPGKIRTAEGIVEYAAPQVRDTPEPFVSAIRAALGGRTEALEQLAVELYARGLSTRDIEDTFTDEDGRRLLSRAAVSEITERLWAEYEGFSRRHLSEHAIVYLFIDGLEAICFELGPK